MLKWGLGTEWALYIASIMLVICQIVKGLGSKYKEISTVRK
jgi:hypothetical protein